MPSNTLINALLNPTAYSHPVSTVSVLETHISWVLLTGEYAYKIKKPVNFGFLDFSTLAQRRFFCTEEVRLNQRLAASLYLEVVPITGTPAHAAINGVGEVIEYAVKMRQFPAHCTLSERAERQLLSADEITQIADLIAHFHQQIDQTDAASHYGDSADIQHWFAENFTAMNPLLPHAAQQQLHRLQVWGESAGQALAAVMQTRKNQGFVRECHGDLHLSNMTLIDAKVTLFDCIEFNPKLRWVDVLSEVAFLFVDLVHSGYEGFAYRLLNRYMQHTGDYGGLVLLPYYLVYRALVCAKIALLRHAQQDALLGRDTSCPTYQSFVDLAERFSLAKPRVLLITHGYSGSGKSSVAQFVAENTGAVLLRSDVERKRLLGIAKNASSGSGLAQDAYSETANSTLYGYLATHTLVLLAAGFSVMVDAAFLKPEQRLQFKKIADDCGVTLLIIAVQATLPTLQQRLQQRLNDASEATLEVLQHQLQTAQGLSLEEQQMAIKVDTETENYLETTLLAISKYTRP